ncbi:MgtC/SapB family protein [Hoylesella pleuritidis]|uniref:MgtC/SapB family protein n=1 Tax=Hoylesella pleuritidis TaxID=407975 RepID=UPI0023566FE8|nr:MgtC/SapB family protein [Hoylesella pleuritidis]
MNTALILHIFIAALLGGIIGLEREYRAKEAGFRTHFLVALGSALFMVVSQYGFAEILRNPGVSLDPSRIAAQVVSGIGFIGAGTIIFQKHVVRGLTTAAGLWVTSAIGLACGAGMYIISITATILVLLCLETIYFILNRFGSRNIAITFTSPDRESIRQIIKSLRKEGSDIDSYDMKEQCSPTGCVYLVNMKMRVKRNQYEDRILDIISRLDGVTIEHIE